MFETSAICVPADPYSKDQIIALTAQRLGLPLRLEPQPEHGYQLGGNISVLVASTNLRIHFDSPDAEDTLKTIFKGAQTKSRTALLSAVDLGDVYPIRLLEEEKTEEFLAYHRYVSEVDQADLENKDFLKRLLITASFRGKQRRELRVTPEELIDWYTPVVEKLMPERTPLQLAG